MCVCVDDARDAKTNDATMESEKNKCVLIKIMAEEQKYINLECKIIIIIIVTATKK